MKAGTKALQKINEEMSIEDVEKLMSDTEEAMEYQNVIYKLLNCSTRADKYTGGRTSIRYEHD